ncbi:MAG: Gfo/Idh/MocA family oxidoreductase [Cytophagales bacterium]|nr:Gfo/Idh/MocA family oxidoreductase [Armatimonadota bacterium]
MNSRHENRKMYRVGFASLVHDHVWGELQHWKALPNVEIVAAGDVNEDLRERFRRETGVPNVYESWAAMLDAEGESLDIVQIAAENNVHAEIVESCAHRGIHCIIEKPMAATLEQARRMMASLASHGTRLMVNWPSAWQPPWQEMERRIVAGEIGDLRYFKYRSAHNGPREIGCDPHFVEWLYDAEKNGAGALMDYCGYGAVMASRLLGAPSRVTGLRGVLAKDYPLPDDNAIVTMQYPHALAVAEASWTQVTGYATNNPVAYGSTGALSVNTGDRTLLLLRPGQAPESIMPSTPVAPYRSGPEYFIHGLMTGAAFEGVCAPEVSLIAQEILEAGLRASDTGQTQFLPL